MMISKIGDSVVGICVCTDTPYPDVGTIITGSPMMFNTGPNVARLGDTVSFSCGMGIIVSGAFQTINAGQPIARAGDSVSGCGNGTIVSMSQMFVFR